METYTAVVGFGGSVYLYQGEVTRDTNVDELTARFIMRFGSWLEFFSVVNGIAFPANPFDNVSTFRVWTEEPR